MSGPTKNIEARLASSDADLKGSLRLRYRVFVDELGAKTEGVDCATQTESDSFDRFCHHIVLVDLSIAPETHNHVIGCIRILIEENAHRAGGFYSENEFDISALKNSGRRLMELGRTCVHHDYRGNNALPRLWSALAEFTIKNRIEMLFGTVSFHGTNIDAISLPLSYLHHKYLAPPELRAKAIGPNAVPLNIVELKKIDQKTTHAELPPILKYYLRCGGVIGKGAWIDYAFNTTDVLITVDATLILPRYKLFYTDKNS